MSSLNNKLRFFPGLKCSRESSANNKLKRLVAVNVELNKIAVWFKAITNSVAEPHLFYAAPALGKNFNAAPAQEALALTPTLLYSKAKFKMN
jgi:hypothetical protein